MAAEVFDRILQSVLILAAGVAVYWLVSRVFLARARGRRLGLESVRPGVPAILYFSMPGCAPCKSIQRPAIEQLQAILGDGLQVIEVDASARPDLADYWGVLSLPTTFVIDSKGRPRTVNHGAARSDRLLRQIEAVERRPALQEGLRKFLWPKKMEM